MRLPSALSGCALPAIALAGDPFNELFTPLFAIGATFGSAVAIVAIVTYAAHRRGVMRYELVRQALEKGQPVPAELLPDRDRQRGAARDLRRGLTLVALGLGLGLFLLFEQGARSGHWSLGLVPGLLGVGYLATWLMTGRPRRESGGAPAQHG